MSILVDTNILLRLAQKHHPRSADALRITDNLRAEGKALAIAHQNVVEFWAVATRPESSNGLGFNAEKAALELSNVHSLFKLLPELPIHDEWQRLVIQYQVSGKNVHDARLVAAMTVHGIGSILTFNVQDFARYSEIRVIDPSAIR